MEHVISRVKTKSICRRLVCAMRVLVLVLGLAFLTACGDLKLNTADIVLQRLGYAFIESQGATFFDIEVKDLYIVHNGGESDRVEVQSNESLKVDEIISGYFYEVITISWLGEDTTSIELKGKLKFKLRSSFDSSSPIITVDDTKEHSFITISEIGANDTLLVSFRPYYPNDFKASSVEDEKEHFSMNVSYTKLRI